MPKKRLNILIVEDSEQDALTVVHLLRQNGFELDYHVVKAKKEMQAHLKGHRYDLIISDYNMVGFTGMEALKLAKTHHSMLPFILLSAFIDQEEELEILENGANEVILKDNITRLPFAVRRVLHEIADKKKLKKLLKTKDKIFSVIAHDLRNTLEGIFVLAESLRHDVGNPAEADSLRENLQMIANTARSTNQLLGNLFDWALMQIGAFKPIFIEIDLNEYVQKSIDIHQTNVRRKNIKISYSKASVKMYGDGNMLSIVFRNLIANAINYSHRGGKIIIKISKKKNEVSVTIKDEGIGIPEELLPKLFDAEDRPKRPGTEQEQSTGFGLLICKDVVAMHGGSISVDSKKGKGSAFSVKLPLWKKRDLVPKNYPLQAEAN
ncbi:MAG: hybrid sensor histidine kinase/response regulator [Balneolaceae bacterium]